MADIDEALSGTENTAEDRADDKNALKAQKKAEKQVKKLEKKTERQQKRRGRLFPLVALFLLIIASGVFLYFSLVNDWGGVRTSMLTAVNKLDPSFHTVQAQKIEQYNAARSQLESDQAALAAERREFDSYKSQQTADLQRQRAELDALTLFVQPIYRQELSEEKIAEIQKLSAMYSSMDAGTAASYLSRLNDDTHAAIILYYMSAADAANILGSMSADFAARVTTILLKD